MHYLTLGTVVSVNSFGDSVLLMITDWNCTDAEGNKWDYVSVPEMLGWSFLETEKNSIDISNYTDAIFFNHEDIEKIFFVGPPNKGNIELEQQAFKDAKEKELPIARYYAENSTSELEVSFDGKDDLSSYLAAPENDNIKQYFPIGTVCVIDVSEEAENEESENEDEKEKEGGVAPNLQCVMIVAVKPYYLANDYNVRGGYDYRVMPWDFGYLSTNTPLCINSSDIVAIVSVGYVNADIQFALQNSIVNDEDLWGSVLKNV